MLSDDAGYHEVKITEDLRLTNHIISGECGGSEERFGGLRIGPSISELMDLESISSEDVFDNQMSLEDVDPFTATFSFTWIFIDNSPYVSISTLGHYSEELSEIEDYPTQNRNVAPNVLYCPIDESVITKELASEEDWGFLDSDYIYKLHKDGEMAEFEIDSVYGIPDKTLLSLLPKEHRSEVLSITI